MSDRAEALWRVPWPQPGVSDVAVLAVWLGLIVFAALALKHVVKLPALAGRSASARAAATVAEARIPP